MTQLTSIIKALGVEKVIWVDDLFAETKIEESFDPIALATTLVQDGHHIKLPGYSPNKPANLDKIARRLAEDEKYREQAQGLVGAANNVVEQVCEAIKDMLQKLGGGSWISALEAGASEHTKTLFLIDRDFSKENLSPEQADYLLKKTIENYVKDASSNYCVVLSQEIETENERGERESLLRSLLGDDLDHKEIIRFSVVSKNGLGVSADTDLSKSLSEKLAGVVLYALLEQVEASLKASIKSLRGILGSQFDDVRKAILYNSYTEGVSEIDVLLRVLQQQHRLEISKSLQSLEDNPLRPLLERFRVFQIDGLETKNKHSVSGDLSRICRAEIISEGPLVNQLTLPVVPGDIFAAWDGTFEVELPQDLEDGKNYSMLVGQLCDIIPRGNKPAPINSAFLLNFKVYSTDAHEQYEQKMSPGERGQLANGRINWIEVGGLYLHFDFRQVASANVTALQLCAFNRHGYAYLKEDEAVDVWALASIAREKREAHKRLTSGDSPAVQNYAVDFSASDSTRGLNTRGPEGGREFWYPVRRVCRMREMEANEALAALERYWRRIPKPHYFAE